jgi:hypothetical protein
VRVLIALAALCGCEAPAAGLSANRAPITHGTITTGDPAVVALVRRGGSTAFCTGTVISTRLVLTAAHCITPDFPDELQIFVGSDLAGTPATYIDAEHVELAPGFDRSTLVNDLALVVLAAPSGVAPVPLSSRPFDATFEGRAIRIVGFGAPGGDQAGALTVKREGVSAVAGFEATTFLFHPAPSQTCAGDSGGPAFATFDAGEALVGVTRSGDPACAEFGRDTRIDPFIEGFVAPFIAATAEGSAGIGDPCYYAANCTSQLCRRAPDDARIRYCTRGCQTAVDCPAGMTCEPGPDALQCQLPTPTPSARGAACATDDDCRDRACVRAMPDQPLACGTSCTGEADPACPSGTRCRPTADAPNRFSCFVPPPPDEGGCSAGRGSGWLGLLVVLLSCAGRARAQRAPGARGSRPGARRSSRRGTARAGTPRVAGCRSRRRARQGRTSGICGEAAVDLGREMAAPGRPDGAASVGQRTLGTALNRSSPT